VTFGFVPRRAGYTPGMMIMLAAQHLRDDRSLIGFLFVMAISGLVFGALGRLLVPGRQSMGILATILAGIAGSIVGGFVARLLFGSEYAPGLLFAALGSALLIWLIYGTSRRQA